MANFAEGLTKDQIEFIWNLGEKIKQAQREKNELIQHKVYLADELIEALLRIKKNDYSAIDSFLKANPIDGQTLAFIAAKISEKTISEEKSIIRKKQLDKDPKQDEKRLVKICWEEWQKNPNQYKSKTKFAQAMLDKFRPDDPKKDHEHLNSVAVIARWCRIWEQEKSQSAS